MLEAPPGFAPAGPFRSARNDVRRGASFQKCDADMSSPAPDDADGTGSGSGPMCRLKSRGGDTPSAKRTHAPAAEKSTTTHDASAVAMEKMARPGTAAWARSLVRRSSMTCPEGELPWL